MIIKQESACMVHPTTVCIVCGLIISILFSCKKDNEDTATPAASGISVSGKAQKGPFKKSAEVVINELSGNLEETGASYSTKVIDDEGSFSFNNINFSTELVSVTATGYYYMEHFNSDASYRLYMEAVSDVYNGSTINVNVLTHLIKPRIEKLVADGRTFTSARTQAQNELKAFLHTPTTDSSNFEDMSLEDSPMLFAVSLLFQRKALFYDPVYNYSNELSHLFINFRSDFRDNGQIDAGEIIDTLLFNANRIDLIDARVNMENYFSTLGLTVSLSGYEQHVYSFQRAYSSMVYSHTVYPDPVTFDREIYSAITCRNILTDTSVYFPGGGMTYNLSAIVPFDSSLQITFTRLSPDTNPQTFSTNNLIYGWLRTDFLNGFTIEAQRNNFPNGMMIWLWGTAPDSARVDYFRDHQALPYFSKIIYWQ